jgi:hypothetical protein
VHFSPKGVVALSQYRKVGVNFTPAGGPIRACLLGGLSRVMGNYHARFLRGRGANTPDLPGIPWEKSKKGWFYFLGCVGGGESEACPYPD